MSNLRENGSISGDRLSVGPLDIVHINYFDMFKIFKMLVYISTYYSTNIGFSYKMKASDVHLQICVYNHKSDDIINIHDYERFMDKLSHAKPSFTVILDNSMSGTRSELSVRIALSSLHYNKYVLEHGLFHAFEATTGCIPYMFLNKLSDSTGYVSVKLHPDTLIRDFYTHYEVFWNNYRLDTYIYNYEDYGNTAQHDTLKCICDFLKSDMRT